MLGNFKKHKNCSISTIVILKMQILQNKTLNTKILKIHPHTSSVLQVQQSQEKIARLEQEKEHWLLEAQLGRVRLEKENQRITELEAQLTAALGGDGVSTSSETSSLTTALTDPDTEEKSGREVSQCTSVVSHLKTLFFDSYIILRYNHLPDTPKRLTIRGNTPVSGQCQNQYLVHNLYVGVV